MSWYRDPELFISYWGWSYGYGIDRIEKKYDVPLVKGDYTCVDELDFYEHLFLGNNKESDYNALKSFLARNVDFAESSFENVRLVNCQGLVAQWDNKRKSLFWTQVEELTSIINSLPGIINPSDESVLDEEPTLEEKNSELLAENSILKEQLKQEKIDKQALQTQVLELTAKLQESRGAGGGSADVDP